MRRRLTSLATSGSALLLVLAGILSAAPVAASGSVTVTADNTGATDTTQAFVNALNTLNAAGGGTLTVPAGTYSIQPGILNIGSNITVSGAGATLLANAGGYSLLGVGGTNIEIDGLSVDGANQILHVVEIGKATSHLTFRGVTVQNGGQGPTVTAPVVGIRVEGDGQTMLFDASPSATWSPPTWTTRKAQQP